MAERRDFEFNVGGRRIPPFLAIILLVLFLVALFMLTRVIVWIPYLIAIPALIASLIIDYRVALGFVQWVINLTRKNLLAGLVVILLSAIGYPLVSVFLLLKSLFNRKVRQIEKQQQVRREGELVDFEELDSKPLDLDRLKEQEKRLEQKRNDTFDEYDELFED